MFPQWFISNLAVLAAVLILRVGKSTKLLCDGKILSTMTGQLSVIVAELTWALRFPHAPKKSRVQWYDFCGLKLYAGEKSIAYFQHNMETVFLQQRNVHKRSYNCHWWRTTGTPIHMLVKKIEGVRAIILYSRKWLSMKWSVICASVMVLRIESSKTQLGFIKSVHSGFQNDSQDCKSASGWQSAKA
jgi:hypothetical protein